MVGRRLHRPSRTPAIAEPADAGLAILKHMHTLSDEVLCERWLENPYYQRRCGDGILLPRAAVRPLVDNPLALAHGRGEACRFCRMSAQEVCDRTLFNALRSVP
jgi:hypothetical protein